MTSLQHDIFAGARPEYHVWGLEPRAWRAREREPITGVWGGAPAGSRGRAPGRRSGGEAPEAENLLERKQICLVLSEP